jgi:hypothetical protein
MLRSSVSLPIRLEVPAHKKNLSDSPGQKIDMENAQEKRRYFSK